MRSLTPILFVLFLIKSIESRRQLQDRIVLFPHLIPESNRAGVQNDNDHSYERIIGGEEAVPNEFPFMVGIEVDSEYFCGGSLISSTVVLTAAHCVLDARAFVVTAGAHRHADPEPTQQIQVSTEAIIHPDWTRYIVENDIAIIKTVGPFTYNDYVQWIPLATLEPPPGDLVTAVGWGRNADYNETISDVLNKVVVPVADDLVCNAFWGFFLDYDRIVCTDTTPDKSFCVGDSGGPLVTADVTLLGVMAYSKHREEGGCDSGEPDAFSAIPYYLDWIANNTGVLPPSSLV